MPSAIETGQCPRLRWHRSSQPRWFQIDPYPHAQRQPNGFTTYVVKPVDCMRRGCGTLIRSSRFLPTWAGSGETLKPDVTITKPCLPLPGGARIDQIVRRPERDIAASHR